MAEIKDTYGSIYQNLVDAGCDEETIGQCMEYVKEGNFAALLPLLSKYRVKLLHSVHDGQKQIDCLDFLIYRLKNITM